jgi:hypothetical protein
MCHIAGRGGDGDDGALASLAPARRAGSVAPMIALPSEDQRAERYHAVQRERRDNYHPAP